MLSSHEASFRSRFLGYVAGAALGVAVSAGLAGCGGGGPGGGAQVTIVPVPSPDLVVESLEVRDAAPAAGTGFTLSATVRNAGGGSAAAKVGFYRSADASITSSDEEVGAADVPELAGSESLDTEVALPAPSIPGTYYYGACVAAVSGESDAGNNCSASARVTVPEPPTTAKSQSPSQQPQSQAGELGLPVAAPLVPRQAPPPPDLVVESPYVSNANLLAGAGFKLTATVRNVGSRGVAGLTARFYRSADVAITKSDTEEKVREMWWSWLAPSLPNLVWQDLTAPSSPGTYYYGVCADGVAGESDTGNNCSASVRVTVREAPPPDILVRSPSAYPARPAARGVFALRVTVRNNGGKTGGVTLRYYRSDDATFTSSDPQVGVYKEGEILTNSSQSPSMTLDSPDDPGTYYYRACADPVAGESDTTNNCAPALRVEVTHAKPNLQIKEWGNMYPKDRSWIGMNAVVRNIGGPSAATTLRFYHSTDKTITPSDTQVDSIAVPALQRSESQTIPRFSSKRVYVTLPASGTHYYGACVDAVADESDTTDNCVRIYTARR